MDFRNAHSDNITDIYFLARDGDIINTKIIDNNEFNLRFHYVLCSRRATQVANIHTKKTL